MGSFVGSGCNSLMLPAAAWRSLMRISSARTALWCLKSSLLNETLRSHRSASSTARCFGTSITFLLWELLSVKT